MCEYCEEQKYISDELLSSVRIQHFEDMKQNRIYTLVVNNNYIKINYCPMCGRKLGD